MKKILSICLTAMIVLTLTACSGNEEKVAEETENIQGNEELVLEIEGETAKQLVSERLNTEVYSVESAGEVDSDGESFFIFKVLEGESELGMGVAVNKISGELYAYKEDKTIAPYEEFTLYDEEKDAVINWEGNFGSDNAVITLVPADAGSFEFQIFKDKADSEPIFVGVAAIEGNTAIYDDSNGSKFEFTLDNEELTIKDSSTKKLEVEVSGNFKLIK